MLARVFQGKQELDIEAEHLPVVMSAMDFVNRSEFVAIQTLA